MTQLTRDFTVIDATGIAGVRNVISNPRVITGYVNVRRVGLVPYEGSLERDFLEISDFSRKLIYAGAQPLRINFTEGRQTRYTPDFLLQFDPEKHIVCPSPILYEIKPKAELKARWAELRPGFLRASALCKSRGWRFRIATERHIRTPALWNIKFLRSYLDCPDDKCLGQIMYEEIKKLGITTPSELLAACFSNKETRMEAVCLLWMLIADGRIRIDMAKPLTMESPIWSMFHVTR